MLGIIYSIAHHECVVSADVLAVCHRVWDVVWSLVEALYVVFAAESVFYLADFQHEFVCLVCCVVAFLLLACEFF